MTGPAKGSDADLKPILDMFGVQLRHPNVISTLQDWRSTLARGMLHFGRREALDGDLEFNTLIYTELHPSPARSGRRIVLEPKLEFVGVISSKAVSHKEFQYLQNELLIVRARGRWDYANNDGPHELAIAKEITVRTPPGADSRAAPDKLLKQIGRLCLSWLLVNKEQGGIPAPPLPQKK